MGNVSSEKEAYSGGTGKRPENRSIAMETSGKSPFQIKTFILTGRVDKRNMIGKKCLCVYKSV